MQPIQGQVTGYHLIDNGYIQVTITAAVQPGAQQQFGQQVATLRLLATDAPALGAIVEVTLRVVG